MTKKGFFAIILSLMFIFIVGCSQNNTYTSSDTSSIQSSSDSQSSSEKSTEISSSNSINESSKNEDIITSENSEKVSENIEKETVSDTSDNNIDTTNLTTEQVEDWTYYHEKSFWEKTGQELIQGDVQYNFQKEANQELKVELVTKWQPLGIYTIDKNGCLFREDPTSHDKEFVTDKYDVE